ncbi:MAG: hypothetical protein ABH828_04360 [archaeon]
MNMKKLVAMMIVGIMLLSLVPLALADDNETEDEDYCESDEDCAEGYFCDEEECEELDDEDDADDEDAEDEEDDEDASDEDEGDESDEDENEDEEDEDDVEVFKVPYGAEVRLIQLERSIDRNIDHGERIIAAILANDENASVDNLTAILEDMEDLIIEIQGMNLENKTPEELAEEYVEIKSRARDLSKLFRDTAREFFTGEDVLALRERLREHVSDMDGMYKEKFEKARNFFNEESLRGLLEKLGIDEETIEEALEQADFEKAKGKIVSEFQKMNNGRKVQAVKNIREGKVKEDVFKKMAVQNARYKYQENHECDEDCDGEGPGYKNRESQEYEDENGSYEIRTRTQVKSGGEVVVKEQIRLREHQDDDDEEDDNDDNESEDDE